MIDWQPISTAPKDKVRILLAECNPVRGWYIGIGQWVVNSGYDFVPEGDLYRKEFSDASYWEWNGNDPTHWQPLPAPPEIEQ